MRASFFFIGSRHRVLLDMFNDRSRPFYQSSFLQQLHHLPLEAMPSYLIERFKSAGKACSGSAADTLAALFCGHPHYLQKLASLVFDKTAKAASEDLVRAFIEQLLMEHEPIFTAQIQRLTIIRLRVLEALAQEPTRSPFSTAFLSRVGMSLSALQHSIKVLLNEDMIEKMDDGILQVTDPFFARWLRGRMA